MKTTVRGMVFLALAVVASLIPLPQAVSQSTNAAYVYIQVQGPAGAVYGYRASASGQLSAISGSPFKPGTAIIGSNNSQFFTLGKTTLHSFAVGSNGAIGSQLGSASIFNYTGNACGGGVNGSDDAVLDHTGKDIYVLLQSGPGNCAAYQSYIINSGGSFTFNGVAEQDTSDGAYYGLPSILGNESFAYASQWIGHYSGVIGFQRQSSGTLQFLQFSETDPTLTGTDYLPSNPDASPVGNYVVLQLYPSNGGGDSGSAQLGNYSVDSKGSLTTTNTSSNMPTTQLEGPFSTFSPDGTMFVLYAGGPSNETIDTGIEIYNFNGANPLTLKTTLLTGTPITKVAWDTSHHLYAISDALNKLWVFNVTPTSVTQVASLSIGSPFSMVVSSLSPASTGGGCTAPSSPGVNVCSPAEEATVSSPVQINATANVSGGVYRFELWNGSTKLASVSNSGTMNQTVSLAAGTYHLTFSAYNTSGTHEYATRDITVK
jgi:hypothetical protein